MASRMVVERMTLRALQRYHHVTLNTFGDHETLIEAVSNRPGIVGPNPVAYLSLVARRAGLTTGDFEEALLNDRTLVRATAFRGSLFLLSTQDYPIYFRALMGLLRNIGIERLASYGIRESQFAHFAKALEEANFDLPKSHEQIVQILFKNPNKVPPEDATRLLVRKLCDLGVLIRTHTKGWKGNEFSYALMSKWLEDVDLSTDNPESARTETIRRYLRCYGPASYEDIAWWTGLPLVQVQRSVSHLRRDAVRVPVEGYKDDLVGLRETIDSLRKPRDVEGDIRFLPPWDAYPCGWLQRRRLVDKEWMPWVFDAVGNAPGLIVDAGRAIGVWQFRDSQVNILEFHVFSTYQHRRIETIRKAESYADTLCKLSSSSSVNLIERPLGPNLLERPLGSFLWPLGRELPFKVADERLFESPMERRSSNTFRNSYLDSRHVVSTGLDSKTEATTTN